MPNPKTQESDGIRSFADPARINNGERNTMASKEKSTPSQNSQSESQSESDLVALAEAAAKALADGVYRDSQEIGSVIRFSPSRLNWVAAMFEVQKEVENPKKNRENVHTKSSYADFHSLRQASREILLKNNFLVLQAASRQLENLAVCETQIIHVPSQEWCLVVSAIRMTKDDPQGLGSAGTYSKRQHLEGVLFVTDANDTSDDDGNYGSRDTQPQVQQSQKYNHIKSGGPLPDSVGKKPPSQRQQKAAEKAIGHAEPGSEEDKKRMATIRSAYNTLNDAFGGRAKEVAESIVKAQFGGRPLKDLTIDEAVKFESTVQEVYRQEREALKNVDDIFGG